MTPTSRDFSRKLKKKLSTAKIYEKIQRKRVKIALFCLTDFSLFDSYRNIKILLVGTPLKIGLTKPRFSLQFLTKFSNKKALERINVTKNISGSFQGEAASTFCYFSRDPCYC
jgi:hypothetical protein